MFLYMYKNKILGIKDMDICKLYPQYNNKEDRRQHNVPVEVDRRSNIDRRKQSSVSNTSFERRIDVKLRNDILQVRDVFQSFQSSDNSNNNTSYSFKNDLESGAENTIPYVRRLKGVNDAVEHHDYLKATGTTLLMLMNVKEDWRDLLKIFKTPNIPRDFQIPFSFTRGTPFEKINILKKYDKTVADTNMGGKILEKLGKRGYQWLLTNPNSKSPLFAFKADGTLTAKIATRTFMRIPILSFVFLSLLEMPSILKSENKAKQIIKSAVTVSSIVTGAAIAGAIGAYLGPLGSLTGIGIGSYYAGKFAKKINSNI